MAITIPLSWVWQIICSVRKALRQGRLVAGRIRAPALELWRKRQVTAVLSQPGKVGGKITVA